MMVKDNRGQGAIEVLLAVGIAIVIATIAGLMVKQLFGQVQTDVVAQTNAVVNQTN